MVGVRAQYGWVTSIAQELKTPYLDAHTQVGEKPMNVTIQMTQEPSANDSSQHTRQWWHLQT